MIQITGLGRDRTAGVAAGAIAQPDPAREFGAGPVFQGGAGVIGGADARVDGFEGGSVAGGEHVEQGLQGGLAGAGELHSGAAGVAGGVAGGDDGDLRPQRHPTGPAGAGGGAG